MEQSQIPRMSHPELSGYESGYLDSGVHDAILYIKYATVVRCRSYNNCSILRPSNINRPLANIEITGRLRSKYYSVIDSTNARTTRQPACWQSNNQADKDNCATAQRLIKLQHISCINISLYKMLIGSRNIRWCAVHNRTTIYWYFFY